MNEMPRRSNDGHPGNILVFLSRGSLKNHCTKATLELKPLSSSHEYIQPTNFTLRNLLWPTRKNLTKQNLVLL